MEVIRAMKTGDIIDLDKAKLDPASVFHKPKDVLGAPGLSIEDKKAILIRWEADAEALLRATEEGMPPAANRSTPARGSSRARVALVAGGCRNLPQKNSAATRSAQPRNAGACSHVSFLSNGKDFRDGDGVECHGGAGCDEAAAGHDPGSRRLAHAGRHRRGRPCRGLDQPALGRVNRF
jgi:hypothetical protein